MDIPKEYMGQSIFKALEQNWYAHYEAEARTIFDKLDKARFPKLLRIEKHCRKNAFKISWHWLLCQYPDKILLRGKIKRPEW